MVDKIYSTILPVILRTVKGGLFHKLLASILVDSTNPECERKQHSRRLKEIDVPGSFLHLMQKLAFCWSSHHGRDLFGNVDQQADTKSAIRLVSIAYLWLSENLLAERVA
jgi:hypothetical protein